MAVGVDVARAGRAVGVKVEFKGVTGVDVVEGARPKGDVGVGEADDTAVVEAGLEGRVGLELGMGVTGVEVAVEVLAKLAGDTGEAGTEKDLLQPAVITKQAIKPVK
jgi:hypothetical protein